MSVTIYLLGLAIGCILLLMIMLGRKEIERKAAITGLERVLDALAKTPYWDQIQPHIRSVIDEHKVLQT